MNERLKRFLPSQTSIALLIKAAVFGVLLLYVQTRDFATFPIIVFLFFALLFYFQPIFRTFSMLMSLIALLGLSLLVSSQFAIAFSSPELQATLPAGMTLFSVIFGFLFYLLLGIKNLAILRRGVWYSVLWLSIMYLSFGLFFSAEPGTSFLSKTLYLFIFIVFMLREFFKFHDQPGSRLRAITILLLAFIIAQLAWAVGLLPIGFTSAASVLVALSYVLCEFTQRYLRGDLTARFIRVTVVLWLALTLLIFFTSTWRL